MRGVSALTVFSLLALSGCAGLRQFPETSLKYTEDLKAKDVDYEKALRHMSGKDEDAQRRLRNEEIDRRIRVIGTAL